MDMLDWFSSFINRKKKNNKSISLRKVLDSLESGDLVQIRLQENFCAHAKSQPLMRFTEKELDLQVIRGIVFHSNFRSDICCYVVEIQSVVNENNTTKTKLTSVLEDEIVKIIKYI